MTEGVLPGGSQPVSNAASVMSVLTCVKKKKKKHTCFIIMFFVSEVVGFF